MISRKALSQAELAGAKFGDGREEGFLKVVVVGGMFGGGEGVGGLPSFKWISTNFK